MEHIIISMENESRGKSKWASPTVHYVYYCNCRTEVTFFCVTELCSLLTGGYQRFWTDRFRVNGWSMDVDAARLHNTEAIHVVIQTQGGKKVASPGEHEPCRVTG